MWPFNLFDVLKTPAPTPRPSPVNPAKPTVSGPYRPKRFEELVGQGPVIETLRLQVKAFKNSGEAVRHTLFLGDSGLGKTTLAAAFAAELGVGFHEVAASDIRKPGDLILILQEVRQGDVLFVDEMHNLNAEVQQWLLTLLLTFEYDERVGGRLQKRTAPAFTFIGATTDAGDLTAALRMRFPYKHQLTPYTRVELASMVERRAAAWKPGVCLSQNVAETIARLSHQTAREGINLLGLLFDVAKASPGGVRSETLTIVNLRTALRQSQIDALIGLDAPCRRYLVALLGESGPVGENTIVSLTGLARKDIAGIIEPRLMRVVRLPVGDGEYLEGVLVRKTPRGRVATDLANQYLARCRAAQENGWFPAERLVPLSATATRVREDGEVVAA